LGDAAYINKATLNGKQSNALIRNILRCQS